MSSLLVFVSFQLLKLQCYWMASTTSVWDHVVMFRTELDMVTFVRVGWLIDGG